MHSYLFSRPLSQNFVLTNRPRLTLQNAMGHIAPFTLRTLLYGDENLDITVNKRMVTETLRFVKDSKRFDQ